MPQVRQDRYLSAAAGERKARGLRRVVRDGEGQHVDAVDVKVLVRREFAPLARGDFAHLVGHRRPGSGAGVDLHAVFARKNAHAADVVDVLVGDEDRADAPHVEPLAARRLVQDLSGPARVDEQQGVVKGGQGAVPRRSAEQRAKFQVHLSFLFFSGRLRAAAGSPARRSPGCPADSSPRGR